MSLTLCDELIRCQVPERAVWVVMILLHPPGFDDSLRLGERRELVDVQTLVAEPPITRFNKSVFHGLTGTNKVELDASPLGLIFPGVRMEFRSMIDSDGAWPLALPEDAIKHRLTVSPVIWKLASNTGL